MTDNTTRRNMSQHEEWMFELIAALKDEILDLRLDRDIWRSLALIQHKEVHDREAK